MSHIEELYRKYRGHIYQLCTRYTRNKDDADDIVQNVFIKAMKGLKAFQGNSSYFTWLYRIAVNECLSYLKKNRKDYLDYANELTIEQGLCTTSNIDRNYFWKKVLTGLNKEDRMLIMLFIFEGVSISDIAEILNITRQAANKRWLKIRKKIAKNCIGQ